MPTSAPTRILLIRPSALGDVARTVPVLVSLRRAYPDAHISWLVQDTFADVIRAHPDLGPPGGGAPEQGVVVFPRREFSQWTKTLRWNRVWAYLRSLRQPRYDLVIDAQGLARSGLFAWATGAPVRIGHRDAREGAWVAYTRRVESDIETHTVDRMLSLAAAAGATPVADMRLYAPPGPEPEPPGVVLAPTSRWTAKQWPDERYAALAARIADAGHRVTLVGGAAERDQIPACLALAHRDPRVRDLVGKTSVAELMRLIERAPLVVANDSAALHLAVGFDRPLVALYGPTRVNRVGPYRRETDVIQHVTPADRLDHKDLAGRALMERITFDEVTEHSLRRLLP